MSDSTSNISTQTTSLQDLLRARMAETLQREFVNLIPPEQFALLSEGVIDEFLHGPRSKRFSREYIYGAKENEPKYREVPIVNGDYNPNRDPATLPGMMMGELQKLALAILKDELDQGLLKETWRADVNQHVPERLKALLDEQAGVFMSGMLAQYMRMIMSTAISQMQQNGGRFF